MFRDEQTISDFTPSLFTSRSASACCEPAGQSIGLLVRDEVGHHREAVFEIVDAELRRFAIGDRTEMTGDLESARMRGIDRRLQLGACDVDIGLERGRAFIRPVVHGLRRVVRTASAHAS